MKIQRTSLVLVIGASLLLLSACSEDSPAPVSGDSPSPAATAPSPQVSAPPSPDTRCPNLSDAVETGRRAGGEATGDVDGDGSEDVVYVVRDDQGPAGCQTFVVAETSEGRLSVPAEQPDVSYALQAPRVHSLVEVDDSPGAEILVDLEQGASTQFLGMFKVVDGALERVRIGGGSAYGNLFPYGGSVGHVDASNCTETAGEVVIIQATPVRRGYRLERTLYEWRDEVLVASEAQPGKPRVVHPESLSAIDELAGSPFGACSRD